MALQYYLRLKQKEQTFVYHYILVIECGLVSMEECWPNVKSSLKPTESWRKGLDCGTPETNASRSKGISTLVFKDLSGQCTTVSTTVQFLYQSDLLLLLSSS